MNLLPEQPVGIFDSGVGGLTVAAAIKSLLPHERLIYFGDTAHLPYGDKSSDSIRYYSANIARFLLDQGCKLVLVACNTASAAAYEDLQEKIGEQALLINVIDPVVEHIADETAYERIGVIGTKGTILSGTYEKKLLQKKPGLDMVSMATPLLVPMIEEGFVYDDISNAIIRAYLSSEKLKNIQALILGCTHYPIIKNQIRKFYNFQVEIIDSAQVVARELKKVLEQNQLLSARKSGPNEFFVSDYTDYFRKISKMFFEEDIRLNLKDLWR